MYRSKTIRPRRLTLLLAGTLMCAGVQAATPIAVSNTRALAFGSFVAGSGGSVTISTSGGRSATGGITLIPSSAGAAAQFSVTGDPGMTYSISLPLDGEAALSNGAGQSMPLNAFASDPGGIGLLGLDGSQTLSVGATLNVDAGQAVGAYSGSFSVTVNYN
jgi:hypothetical protein